MDVTDRRGFIYLVRLREHIALNENVFKAGRTRDITRRIAEYPNGSALLFTIQVPDMCASETLVMACLRSRYIQRLDIGREYFQGNLPDIRSTIFACTNALVPTRPPLGTTPKVRLPGGRSQNATCDQVVTAMMTVPNDHMSCRALPLATVVTGVRNFADDHGLVCRALSGMNISHALVSHHGCKIEHRQDAGDVVLFPGFSDPAVPDKSPLDCFIDDVCTISPGLRVSTKEFVDALNIWSCAPHSNKFVSKEMRKRGFAKKKDRVNFFIGLSLRQASQ